MEGHSKIQLGPGDVLILVDLQNDFLPGGALAVPEGSEVLKPLNQAIARFRQRNLLIVATRDWHPFSHASFKERGGPWPRHCVAGSDGARFSSALHLPPEAIVISKATEENIDAYSGFEGTELETVLKNQKIKRVFIGGLATDYCVLNTVRDAIQRGFKVFLLQDGVRAVNVHPGDGEQALAEMESMGAGLTLTGDFVE